MGKLICTEHNGHANSSSTFQIHVKSQEMNVSDTKWAEQKRNWVKGFF